MHLLGFAPVGVRGARRGPEKDCYVLPSSMPFSDAAAMGIGSRTAHIALLDRGQLRRGETVLINGAAGGVGLAAVQVAKAKGAVVLAGLTTLTKAEVVRASGADYVIDLTQSDLAKSLRDQVFAVTGGRGANVVIDLIGGDVFDASMRALAWRGRAVVIGFVSNRIPVIKTNYLLIKNVSASGLFWDSYRREASDEVRAVQEDLFALYTAGKIKPVIMEALPLEQIGRAFGRITRREVVGRVLLIRPLDGTPRAAPIALVQMIFRTYQRAGTRAISVLVTASSRSQPAPAAQPIRMARTLIQRGRFASSLSFWGQPPTSSRGSPPPSSPKHSVSKWWSTTVRAPGAPSGRTSLRKRCRTATR